MRGALQWFSTEIHVGPNDFAAGSLQYKAAIHGEARNHSAVGLDFRLMRPLWLHLEQLPPTQWLAHAVIVARELLAIKPDAIREPTTFCGFS